MVSQGDLVIYHELSFYGCVVDCVRLRAGKGEAEGGFIYLILLWYVFWDTGGLTMPLHRCGGCDERVLGYYSCVE